MGGKYMGWSCYISVSFVGCFEWYWICKGAFKFTMGIYPFINGTSRAILSELCRRRKWRLRETILFGLVIIIIRRELSEFGEFEHDWNKDILGLVECQEIIWSSMKELNWCIPIFQSFLIVMDRRSRWTILPICTIFMYGTCVSIPNSHAMIVSVL
jgi:hypothetical protein